VDQTAFNHYRGGYGSIDGWDSSQISFLEAATKSLQGINMSATMARQGGRVKLKQSDMCLALHMGKIAEQEFSGAAVEETQCPLKNPCAEDPEEKKQVVEVRGYEQEKAAIEDNWLCFVETIRTDGFIATMAPQRFGKHTGGAKAQVHLHPANTGSRHHNRRHLYPECDLHHPVTMRELIVPISMLRGVLIPKKLYF